MIIHEFSKFLINLQYDDIPKESIEKAKLCFLDYLSVYKRGLNEENSKILIKTLQNLGYSNDIFTNGLIKGIASHSLDLDDGHRLGFLHPGTIVFSTALSIIEDEKLLKTDNFSTKNFFEAVVGGYEIAIVLGKLVNPIHRNQGFHSTGTIGAFIAGAVASKLLKLDLNQTINCLGLCGTQSAGLLESDHAGSMAKSLHVGKAVYNGLLSAFLAKEGFTGAESIIDGNEGFLKAYVYDFNFDDFDFNLFLEENLGKFHINEVYLKKYPFCRHIHSAIDAILYLREYLFSFEDNLNYLDSDENLNYPNIENLIDEITVETYKIASEHDDYNPKTKPALKQSLPFAIAIYLVCGDLSLDEIDNLITNGLFEDCVDNNSLENQDDNNKIEDLKIKFIKNILNKITIYENSELEDLTPVKRPSKVIIKLNENYKSCFDFDKQVEKTVYYPLGESENPLEWLDILDKFSNLNSAYDLNKLEIIKYLEDKDINNVLDLVNF